MVIFSSNRRTIQSQCSHVLVFCWRSRVSEVCVVRWSGACRWNCGCCDYTGVDLRSVIYQVSTICDRERHRVDGVDGLARRWLLISIVRRDCLWKCLLLLDSVLPCSCLRPRSTELRRLLLYALCLLSFPAPVSDVIAAHPDRNRFNPFCWSTVSFFLLGFTSTDFRPDGSRFTLAVR